MIPYPSMRSLIEGQNIKFSNQLIIQDLDITNKSFYTLVQQTAHWLEQLGFKPREKIIIPELKYPQSEILLYGVWHLGSIAVIPSDKDISDIKKVIRINTIIDKDIDLFKEVKDFPIQFEPKYKPLLDDEAIVTFEKDIGIRLSHYNLLVNVNSLQKSLGLKSRTRFSCDLKPRSSSWAVLKAILPVYCGFIIDNVDPEITIGESKKDYNIRYDIHNLSEFSNTDIAICPENSAVLSIGTSPMHLTNFSFEKKTLMIQGHSVMMGYTDDSTNESCFKDQALFLNI